MDIPYGRSNFEEIRRKGYFYVDKTRYLPILERGSMGYPLLLRPRRFGKSTFLSLLETYYDIAKKEQFEELFKGLWVGDNPTRERNSYLILSLDFSTITAGGGHEGLRRSFFESVRDSVLAFLLKYREFVPVLGDVYDRLGRLQHPEALLGTVLAVLSASHHKLYVLIDEYDHFANRLLSADGAPLYDEAITRRTGFARTFFSRLKVGTRTGSIGRMFITGVTPFMLGDLTSGLNIMTHASPFPDLNAVAGFSRAEVETALEAFFAARPDLTRIPPLSDRQGLLAVLEQDYGGYRFSPAATERVFNPDMVLNFLREVDEMRGFPVKMLDRSLRSESCHSHFIGMLAGVAAGHRDLVSRTLSEGGIRSDLVDQLDLAGLSSRASYVSLLYYLGMLTLDSTPRSIQGHDLEIPNRAVRELHWEPLVRALLEAKAQRRPPETVERAYVDGVSLVEQHGVLVANSESGALLSEETFDHRLDRESRAEHLSRAS
ncbi:MAG: AAA family ATPase [Polyangiaceae bacterium]